MQKFGRENMFSYANYIAVEMVNCEGIRSSGSMLDAKISEAIVALNAGKLLC